MSRKFNFAENWTKCHGDYARAHVCITTLFTNLPLLPLIVIDTNLSYFFVRFTWCMIREDINA